MLTTYLEKRTMILRYFMARTRDATIAEDILQELYLKIAALPEGYDVENETAFLFRTAQNIWLNMIRGKTRALSREGQWLDTSTHSVGMETVADTPSAETVVGDRQQVALMQAAVKELPDKTQRIFRLHKFDGLNQAEVAAKIGMSKSSVEKHLSSALKHLMARLNPRSGP